MKIITIDLKGDYAAAVTEAVKVLRAGGVIVYPTETIYGIGANACDPRAVEMVFRVKGRSRSKPLSILARNLEWVRELAHVSPKLETVLKQIWPGPTTVILGRKTVIPAITTAGMRNIGIRVSDLPFTERLLAMFGYPITATSANLSGEEGTGDITAVIQSFKNSIWKPDLIIDAGKLPHSLPSTILDLSTVRPTILRAGQAKQEDLVKILGLNEIKNA